MNYSILYSRRAESTVDFSPSLEKGSPDDQARRLFGYLRQDTGHVFKDEDITDCPEALNALREYQYRKIFGGTSHAEFLELDATDPKHIDWAIRVHEIETEVHKSKTAPRR